MNRAHRALVRTQQFVSDHRVAIAVITTATATTAAMVAMQKGAVREVNDFLESKGLLEEFHNRFNDLDN